MLTYFFLKISFQGHVFLLLLYFVVHFGGLHCAPQCGPTLNGGSSASTPQVPSGFWLC